MTSKESRPVLRGLVGSNAHPATQLIDFLAVLFGYAISGERTLETFYIYVSCPVVLQSSNRAIQALLTQNTSAFLATTNDLGSCAVPYQRILTAYMIGGVVLVGAVAVVIYWLFPIWNLWRGKLVPLSVEDSPELMTYLIALCREAQLTRQPSFVCNPFNRTVTGLAFGRIGRYYIALSGGLITLFSTDRPSFRIIVLHELAHLRNADVNKTYFAIASWWAFVLVALVPFAALSVISAVKSVADFHLLLNETWRVLVMVVFIFLVLAATLRAREFYADARAAVWENSANSLLRVLTKLEMPKNRWPGVTHLHPDPRERGLTLNEPDHLFRVGFWEALGLGIAIGIAAPNVLDLVNALFYSLPQITFSSIPNWQTFGAALILAPLIAVAAGLNTWRTTFAALLQGRTPRGIGRAGLCIGIGLFLGTFLPLSASTVVSSLTNTLFLFILSLPWAVVVLLSLFLFLRWIAAGISPWLAVITSSHSPRPLYIINLGIASCILIVVLVQLFLFRLIVTEIAGLLSTSTDLLSGFTVVTGFSILLLIYNTLLSPGVFVAFVCLWAFPLAVWFWRKDLKTTGGPIWAFLDASSPQNVALPNQSDFRLRFALMIGLAGGLAYCALLLGSRIMLHLGLSDAVRSTADAKNSFYYAQVVLAVLIQMGVGAIGAARIRRLGWAHGFYAAFIAGCVMTIGMVGLTQLSYCADILAFGPGHSCTESVGWEYSSFTFSWIVNGGALLVLPVVVSLSALTSRLRRPHREIVISHEGRYLMICSYCGAQNRETASFCQTCGKRMEGKRANQIHPPIFQGTLLFLAGSLAGRSFSISPPVTTLGSDPRNTIVIPDPAVAAFHARLVLTGSGWVIELLTTQSMLMVNQTQARQQLLRNQDVIRLGSATVFRYDLNMGRPQYPQPPVPPTQSPPQGQGWQPQPLTQRQQLSNRPLLSRRAVLIGGAALVGGLLLVVGSGKIISSFTRPQPFQHVALGTHLVTYHGHDAPVLTVAWSPDSNRIASGANSYDPTVRVWNALDGTTVYTYTHYVLSPGYNDAVESLAWSPGGMRIVTTGNTGDAHVWDASNGGNDTILELPSTLSINTVNQVVWSPDGQRIAAACSGIDATDNNIGTVLLWDAGNAKALTSYTVQSLNPGINSVAWSPDSTRIAAAVGNTVQVLEVSNWHTIFTYPGNNNLVSQVAWSPDGTMIASCVRSTGSGEAPTVQVWNASNGSNVSIYLKHQGDIWTVTWSPDSKRVVSGGDDWKVHVWNAADASQVYVYSAHSDGVNQVAWSPDGTRIASASSDQTVQVWVAG